MRRRRWPSLFAAFVLLVAAAGGAAVWLGLRFYDAPGPLTAERIVVVPRGGADEVAVSLSEAGAIGHPLAFRLAARLTRDRGKLRAGEFALPAHASLRDVLAVLRTARPVQHRFTIAEGLTAHQIAGVLGRAETLDGDAPVVAEGSLLPQTYAYELGATRIAIAERAQGAMDRALEEAWQSRAPDLPLANPREALILASMIERETARPEERAEVAAVFVNRLRLGMKLQSDPTVIYGISAGTGTLDRPLSHADLDRDDPFNTYRHVGLPPGPICAPGLASLVAATHPAAVDDLYFVADGTGGHAFARTMPEHARNVARWKDEHAPVTR